MRTIVMAKSKVPMISKMISKTLLDLYGIQICSKGFYGLPEDMEEFFKGSFMECSFAKAFQIAKAKWNDGNVCYIE